MHIPVTLDMQSCFPKEIVITGRTSGFILEINCITNDYGLVHVIKKNGQNVGVTYCWLSHLNWKHGIFDGFWTQTTKQIKILQHDIMIVGHICIADQQFFDAANLIIVPHVGALHNFQKKQKQKGPKPVNLIIFV